MKHLAKTLTLFTLCALVASPLMADDGKKAKGKKGGQLLAGIMKKLADADLTEEQTEKLKTIAKEWTPKIAEATKKAALTKEQRASQKAAMEKAKADGKKGKEMQAAVKEALGLSNEQQEAMDAAGKLRQQFMAAVAEVLTPEQRKAAKIGGKPKGKKPADGKKKKKNAEVK